ncbi:MAG: asparaginase [Pyrinomonadaceae bacterium]
MTKNQINDIPLPAPLVEVRRGAITESRHRGHIAAVDPDGNVLAKLGSPETLTFLRSSCKPHQALPLVASGAADHFGFIEKEIAVACGSHSGEPIHTAAVSEMLRKIGLDQSALKCGTHEPFSQEVARQLRETRTEPNVLQNNCSGKHAGMLALARHLNAPTESYDQPDSPVQLLIGRTVAQFSEVKIEDISVGIDGCGVPVFGITVLAMARMYARLVAPPVSFDEETREACRRIVGAMISHPEMVGGTTERLDTEMIRAAKGRLISKVGAEGVYTVGVLPCPDWPHGLGLALKIEDGEDRRARPTVVIEALRQLGVLKDESLEAVASYAFFPITNRHGDVVGEVRASFDLERTSNAG